MRISELKNYLANAQELHFRLPTGAYVPAHFHVTEVGLVSKHFIDCGGCERLEKTANFQLWNANDIDHRLKPKKLLDIILLAEQKLGIGDFEIEVEYQTQTIGKYGLGFGNNCLELIYKQTDCLAKENCGIEQAHTTDKTIHLASENTTCSPGGGCC